MAELKAFCLGFYPNQHAFYPTDHRSHAESTAWLNKFTTTTAADKRCTNFDLAMNNCDFKSGMRALKYDSSKSDYLKNWDAIVDAGGESSLRATSTTANTPTVAPATNTATNTTPPAGTVSGNAIPVAPITNTPRSVVPRTRSILE